MAITRELIEILVCPETKQSLKLADRSLVDSFNAKIRTAELCDRAKKTLEQEVSDLLIREDGEIIYQVRGDIPILLVDEGVAACDLSRN